LIVNDSFSIAAQPVVEATNRTRIARPEYAQPHVRIERIRWGVKEPETNVSKSEVITRSVPEDTRESEVNMVGSGDENNTDIIGSHKLRKPSPSRLPMPTPGSRSPSLSPTKRLSFSRPVIKEPMSLANSAMQLSPQKRRSTTQIKNLQGTSSPVKDSAQLSKAATPTSPNLRSHFSLRSRRSAMKNDP
jgi:hypothetical protein